MSNKKPDSFKDLGNQFPKGASRFESSLVFNRYALEFRDLFAKNWESTLKALTASKKIQATDFVVISALEALTSFSAALDSFRKAARPTSKQANQIDALFWELERKMALIPGLNLSLSTGVLNSQQDIE